MGWGTTFMYPVALTMTMYENQSAERAPVADNGYDIDFWFTLGKVGNDMHICCFK